MEKRSKLMKHIIVQMPIDDSLLQWATSHYPELIVTQYSQQRNNYLLLSRALLSHTLRTYFDCPTLPKINYQEHGKPYFIEHPQISFNITHTNQTMMIVIADQDPVGIDVETIRPRKNFQGLETRVLKPNEVVWLHKQTNYIEAFFMIWSAKEAYLKAVGTGLSGLESLTLDFDNLIAKGPLTSGYLYTRQNNHFESCSIYLTKKVELNTYQFNGSTFEKCFMSWKLSHCM